MDQEQVRERPSCWKMSAMCDNCPFAASGPGAILRKSLRPGRWQEILRALRSDQYFPCHKTTRETGTGKPRICAGALAWQERRGLSSNFQRVMERVDYIFRGRSK